MFTPVLHKICYIPVSRLSAMISVELWVGKEISMLIEYGTIEQAHFLSKVIDVIAGSEKHGIKKSINHDS